MSKVTVNVFFRSIGLSLSNDPRARTFTILTSNKRFEFPNDDLGVLQTLFEERIVALIPGLVVSPLNSRPGTDARSLHEIWAFKRLDGELMPETIDRLTEGLRLSYEEKPGDVSKTFAEVISGSIADKVVLDLDEVNAKAQLAFLQLKYPEGERIGEVFHLKKRAVDFSAAIEEVVRLCEVARKTEVGPYQHAVKDIPWMPRVSEACASSDVAATIPLDLLEAGQAQVGQTPVDRSSPQSFIIKHFEYDVNSLDDRERSRLYWTIPESEFSKNKKKLFASFFPRDVRPIDQYLLEAMARFREAGILRTVTDEEALDFLSRQVVRLRGAFVLDRVAKTLSRK